MFWHSFKVYRKVLSFVKLITLVSSTILAIIDFHSVSTFPKSVASIGRCFLISGEENIGSR